MPSAEFGYKEQDSAIFGTVKRPLLELEVFSERDKKWLPLYKVLADTGADISILPRYIGNLVITNILDGRHIEIRGIVPYSKLTCFIHELRFNIGGREFKLPVAVADSDDVPIVLGRVKGLDVFRCIFDGDKTFLEW